MAKILVAEDETNVAQAIADLLRQENHTVEIVSDGDAGLELLRFYKYELLILDWGLPGKEGIEICRQFRAAGGNTPILMLTARNATREKRLGLDAGADDYLTKPFEAEELAARVRALLRRPAATHSNLLRIKDIVVDTTSLTVTRADEVVALSPKELSLLTFLLRHPNQVFTPEALLDRVWESSSDTAPDMIRTYVKKLRAKLDRPGEPSIIQNLHGQGYRLSDG